MARIMIQGTASSVGKSILVTALCRILKQDGFRVCPYKSQNMSLNSYITLDGKEMGRAQVLQAYAAGLEPEVYMNPILLKPSADKMCQVIVKGKVFCNCSAMEYHNMKLDFATMLKEDFEQLEKKFDVMVIEGAGSPAEINLRDRDIVNMGLAEMVDAPVVLVGDIDKGGVFAALAGTMLLLKDEEKKRVKGTIINKFRGDVEILKPGLDMIEDIIHIPCLGVIPYFRLALEDEDGAIEFNTKITDKIDIAVIKLPHISNFTDFDALKMEQDVSVRFISKTEDFGSPDLVIIPGSKNTIEDLLALRKSGIETCIVDYAQNGMVIGICGGFQMLGKVIKDPYETETLGGNIMGMGLLNIETIFEQEKVTERVEGSICQFALDNCPEDKREIPVYGYEIHMGICNYGNGAQPLTQINKKSGEKASDVDGGVNDKGNIIGTYIHGIFDSAPFREYIVNLLRKKKGLTAKTSKIYENEREAELDKLADLVRNNLNMDKIYEMIGLGKP